VAAVALLLLRAQGGRHLDGEARFLPLAEPARHRGHVRVAEVLQRPRGQRGARAARAVEDDLPSAVRHLVLDARLEEAAGDEQRAGHVALRPFVRLAHVDHDRVLGAGAGVGGRDLADLGADAADHLLERGHALLQPREARRGPARWSFAWVPVRRGIITIAQAPRC
jgi:hypothetical protein